MDDKKQDFKQNLKSYVSDEKIAKSDDYFEEKPVNVGVNDDVNGYLMLLSHKNPLNQRMMYLKKSAKNTLKKKEKKTTKNTKTTSKTIHPIGI